MNKKRGIVTEYLPWLIIGLAVLGLFMVSIFLLKGKGVSIVDKIQNLFKGWN